MTQRQEIEKVYDMIFLQECGENPEEVTKAHANAMDYLITHKMPEKIKLSVDDLLCDLEATSERSGFIYGFKYAVRLLAGGDVNVRIK